MQTLRSLVISPWNYIVHTILKDSDMVQVDRATTYEFPIMKKHAHLIFILSYFKSSALQNNRGKKSGVFCLHNW